MPRTQTSIRSRGPFAVSFALAIVGLAAPASQAHDEDWRKLQDWIGAVPGEMYLYGQSNLRGSPFASDRVTLLAQIPLNFMPGSPSGGNDCWGYTSPSGREYAIMGVNDGYVFYEITTPASPQLVGRINGPDSLWHDIKVVGEYAYGVSEGGSGIQVIDLTAIDTGTVTLVANAQTGGHITTHNIVANQEAGELYICGGNIGNGGLIRVDLTNPASPVIDDGWTEMYVHDAQVVTYDSGPYAGRDVAFCFAGFGNGSVSTGLRIVDITDPSNAFTISTLFYPASAYCHQGWISEDKQYLFLNDELDEDGGIVSTTTTRVIDVSDLDSPFVATTLSTGLASIDHNNYVKDGLLYQANYRSGLRVFDVRDPLNATEIAWLDTFPGSDAAEFNGAWSVYPYFDSGTLIVSDIERGLFVAELDVDDALPLLLSVTPAPQQIAPGQSATVAADVVPGFSEALVPGSVTLHLSYAAGSEFQIPMQGTGGNGFEASLPGSTCDATPSYYVSAQTSTGRTVTMPAGAPTETYTFEPGTSTLLAGDSMESNSGWIVGLPSDTATTGVWDRSDPEGTEAQPENDITPLGTQCWVTGGSSGGSLGANDVDDGATTLTSPAYDLLASPSTTTISYWRWYSNSTGANPGTDVFRVQISGDGSAWTEVETVGPSGIEAGGGWFQHTFNYTDLIFPSNSVRLRFIAEDSGSGSIVEAAIDDLEINTFDCDSAAADCNANGIVDLDEIALGLADDANLDGVPDSCAVPSCVADINTTGTTNGVPDGTINLADLQFYLTNWQNDLGPTPGSVADVNSTGTTNGVPDGTVNLADLQYFLSQWQTECQ